MKNKETKQIAANKTAILFSVNPIKTGMSPRGSTIINSAIEALIKSVMKLIKSKLAMLQTYLKVTTDSIKT